MPTKIIAIDPGFDRCGVALITASHPPSVSYSQCIVTNKKQTQEQRVLQIFKELEGLIINNQPDILALETLFFSANKKTALKVAEARGVIVLLAGLHNIPLLELSPQEIKLALTGSGNADKKQVQKMVELIQRIPLEGKLDDEIDAIALGLTAAQHIRFR